MITAHLPSRAPPALFDLTKSTPLPFESLDGRRDERLNYRGPPRLGLSRNAIRFRRECSSKDGGSFCRYWTDLYTRSFVHRALAQFRAPLFTASLWSWFVYGGGSSSSSYRKVISLAVDRSFGLIIRADFWISQPVRGKERARRLFKPRNVFFLPWIKSIRYRQSDVSSFEWRMKRNIVQESLFRFNGVVSGEWMTIVTIFINFCVFVFFKPSHSEVSFSRFFYCDKGRIWL